MGMQKLEMLRVESQQRSEQVQAEVRDAVQRLEKGLRLAIDQESRERKDAAKDVEFVHEALQRAVDSMSHRQEDAFLKIGGALMDVRTQIASVDTPSLPTLHGDTSLKRERRERSIDSRTTRATPSHSSSSRGFSWFEKDRRYDESMNDSVCNRYVSDAADNAFPR